MDDYSVVGLEAFVNSDGLRRMSVCEVTFLLSCEQIAALRGLRNNSGPLTTCLITVLHIISTAPLSG